MAAPLGAFALPAWSLVLWARAVPSDFLELQPERSDFGAYAPMRPIHQSLVRTEARDHDPRPRAPIVRTPALKLTYEPNVATRADASRGEAPDAIGGARPAEVATRLGAGLGDSGSVGTDLASPDVVAASPGGAEPASPARLIGDVVLHPLEEPPAAHLEPGGAQAWPAQGPAGPSLLFGSRGRACTSSGAPPSQVRI